MAKLYSRELRDVSEELDRVLKKFPKKWTDAHHGIALVWEEFEELKAEVWKKQRKRKPAKMRKEAIQVAAMAIRFAMECCD
jgi:hypothetical protein